MKIAIIGMMGSGKTEIGRMLSARMSLDCVDLDAYIEESAHLSIVDIFRVFGEAQFRAMESHALEEIAARDNDFVLCCGGGAILIAENRELLRRRFISVWLEVPLEEIERRLIDQRSRRPLLLEAGWKEKLEALYAKRGALYEASAQLRYRWRRGHGAEESAAEIERLILAPAVPEDLQE